MPDVYDALRAEAGEIDALVAGLAPQQWSLATPAPGWTVAHQIAHLAFIAHLAGLAVTDPEGFEALAKSARVDFQAAVDAALADYLADPAAEILARWRTELAAATDALAAVPSGAMVRWLVNPLPPEVIAAAGMMEIFAHGQDVADALGAQREPHDRWRYIAAFGARTRDFGYLSRGLTPPQREFRFELTGPSGDLWEFGPAGSDQVVSGPAADFCLLVTRRRHRDDLALVAQGEEADRWLDIAQAYRGPAGDGPARRGLTA